MTIRKRIFWGALLISFTVILAACTSASRTTEAPTDEAAGGPASIDVTLSPTGPQTITPRPTRTPTPTPDGGIVPVPMLDLPDIAEVVARVRGSVVSVVSEVVTSGLFGGTSSSFQSGSGIIFDPGGYILTNNHVIAGARSVVVTLDDGRQLNATILGVDRLTDLAVLKVEDESLPYITFADPAGVRVGQWAIAIGNALALPGGPSVTLGIVSALDRSFQIDPQTTLYDLIQTDTIINPGNSGGPLLNLAGEVVGINTAVIRGGRVEGIGFAVGGETAILVSRELIESGQVHWPWLGVSISELDVQQAAERGLPVQHGILVQNVLGGSPAAKGGLKDGDVMLSMSGNELPTLLALTRVLRFEFSVGDVVEVEVWRKEERLTLPMTLGERPPI